MLAKVIGQLAEGNAAWLRLVDPDGKATARYQSHRCRYTAHVEFRAEPAASAFCTR